MEKNKKILVLIILAVVAIGFGVYQLTPKHNVFVNGPSMHYSRVGHTATLLKDGRVLIVGGRETQGKNTGHGLNIAEIYDPKTSKFEIAGKLNTTREVHKAILLKNGDVFICGGQIGLGMKYIQYVEEYNYDTNRFKLLKNMFYQRVFHTATLLNNGNVLITGGESLVKNKNNNYYNSLPIATSEIYDLKNNKPKLIADMNVARAGHKAILLKDGIVLITGGDKEGTAEIYNPKTNEFKLIGKLNKARYGHSAYLLKNGKVLLVGGDKENTVEMYNPKNNKFELTGKLIEPERSGYTTALLDNDSVLILGGTKPGISWGYIDLKSSEIYNPITQKTVKGPSMRRYRAYPTATTLLNGDVLVCGGTDVYFGHKNSCEVYKK